MSGDEIEDVLCAELPFSLTNRSLWFCERYLHEARNGSIGTTGIGERQNDTIG